MKKHLILLTLILAMQNTNAQAFGGGNGTQFNPYLIYDISHINLMRDSINLPVQSPNYNWSYDKYFMLMDDIIGLQEPIGGTRWISTDINHNGGVFEGNFDGNGYKITLNISGSGYGSPKGLFSLIAGATIENVIVDGYINVTGRTNNTSGEAGHGVAGIAAFVEYLPRDKRNLIKNCINNATITVGDIVAPTGGILGNGIFIDIIDCINMGEILRTATNMTWVNVGGIAGDLNNSGTITNCLNIANIYCVGLNNPTGLNRYCIGGIAGQSTNSIITKCINAGHINFMPLSDFTALTNNAGIGGIIGHQLSSADGSPPVPTNITIIDCINTGVVEGHNTRSGAIFGNIQSARATFINCHYDKQFCNHKGVNGADVSGVSPHLTRNMVGRKLANLLGNNDWTYVEGATTYQSLYPQLKTLDNTDASKVGASPIYLYDGIKD
ncbi:MAG: hypothetical protein FWG85_02765 [Bacteroidetes bacterium]|nr:hypothetical protein [Bacteroidota bacterium]